MLVSMNFMLMSWKRQDENGSEHTKMKGWLQDVPNPEAWLWSRTATGLVIHGAVDSFASFCT